MEQGSEWLQGLCTLPSGVDSGSQLRGCICSPETYSLAFPCARVQLVLGLCTGVSRGCALYLAYPRDGDATECPQHVGLHPRWWLKHKDSACTEQVHWHLRDKVASVMSAFILGPQGVADLKFSAVLLPSTPSSGVADMCPHTQLTLWLPCRQLLDCAHHSHKRHQHPELPHLCSPWG